jgi:transcriptional regulator with XRE-family HTH domain
MPRKTISPMRRARQAVNLNLTQAARKLRRSIPMLSKYERAQAPIPSNLLPKMAKLYGVSVDYLLGLTHDGHAA